MASPPTGNRANDEVVALVAREFNVKEAAVTLTAGTSSRQKRVKLEGIDVRAAERVIDRLLEPSTPPAPPRR